MGINRGETIMTNKYLQTNNISTIATWLAITITAILSYFGFTVDQATLLPVISGVITLIIAIWSSKNPNDLNELGNGKTKVYSIKTCENKNEEYSTGDEDGGA